MQVNDLDNPVIHVIYTVSTVASLLRLTALLPVCACVFLS